MKPPIRLLVIAAAALAVALGNGAAARAQTPGFTFVGIGDTGDEGPVLSGNGRAITALVDSLARTSAPVGLLLFAGDNFYPNGLTDPAPAWQRLRDAVLAPFVDVMRRLGRDNVHAITGNHDYYCSSIMAIPYGFCGVGNRREAAIDLWQYHYFNPVSLRRALAPGTGDSVEFLLFDSSYLLARPTPFWRPLLDTMERILRASATRPGVRWRIIVAHHSLFSIGEHAGWRRWMPSLNRIGYIGNCRREGQDPFRYLFEFVSSEDLCTERYRRYVDTMQSLIQRSGARIQLMMCGHEHSLELLNLPDSACALCPQVYAITGAGSKRDKVKSPAPPREYTHPLNNPVDQGRSEGGFLVGTFRENGLTLEFRGWEDGEILEMGGGATRFEIDEAGRLVSQ